jgi:hypothetical protein
VKTGPDIIEILDESGNIYLTLNENENTTNVMITEHSSVSSIVHVIDKVLIP